MCQKRYINCYIREIYLNIYLSNSVKFPPSFFFHPKISPLLSAPRQLAVGDENREEKIARNSHVGMGQRW